ncbi:hypothetical protein [Tychonema sp. LEGE 06208]|uniref:hypothetical protein n=1 Tax=Tychonema sp. LEGE 06208 TaxID=1828663 RepID=UPI001882ADF3|nr:hypothetical protein [Tychonema sp. LEGE 06208]MBE9164973.1 hypothetical protein [Tychonema sp. LEGE 06208]
MKKVQIIEEGSSAADFVADVTDLTDVTDVSPSEEGKTNYRMGLTDLTGSLALPGNLYLEALPRWGKRRQSRRSGVTRKSLVRSNTSNLWAVPI